MLKITRVYDDRTENLLNQYKDQLAYYEDLFHSQNIKLSNTEYAEKRDIDPVMCEILEVIAQIYSREIPIALVITDNNGASPTRNPKAAH